MAVRHPYPGRPLRLGSEGRAVAQLQERLSAFAGPIAVDGEFGPETDRKVKRFQANRKLGADGVVTKVIWHRIFDLPAPTLHPRRPETEVDTLNRLREEVPVRQGQIRREKNRRRRSQLQERLRAVVKGIRARVRPSGPPATVLAVYRAAQAIHDKQYPYVWGGGHAYAGRPDRGTGRDPGIGYDCSGSTAAALAAAGLGYRPGDSVPASGTMAEAWGTPGRGRWFTVWANWEHVWIQWHLPGKAWRFDTSPWGSGGSGPEQRAGARPTTGFTPRHWPGL